jgi:predicted transcriptional regulator
MKVQTREKFATQVNSEILRSVRHIAHKEGRQLQVLIDEALADLIEKRKQSRPRAHIMAVYQASHEKFAPLYKKLAE